MKKKTSNEKVGNIFRTTQMKIKKGMINKKRKKKMSVF